MARLAASVAHEIGNPLQSLRSCIDLCREDSTLATQTAEYLELASGELRHMSQILGRLRDLYRQPLSEKNHE
jgi:signal transduction histidine kinase